MLVRIKGRNTTIKTFKVSRLGIDTNTYALWFHREPHVVGKLVDKKDQSYFNECERLTAAEITEIENWPGTVNELFDRKESKGLKDDFLRCLRGVLEPETSTERIVTKLIHQALAMGGLHCRLEGDGRVVPQTPRELPSNDIVNFKALPLRSFLLGVQMEMAERVNKEWQESIRQFASDANVSVYPDDPSGHDPRWSENEQIEDIPDEWWWPAAPS